MSKEFSDEVSIAEALVFREETPHLLEVNMGIFAKIQESGIFGVNLAHIAFIALVIGQVRYWWLCREKKPFFVNNTKLAELYRMGQRRVVERLLRKAVDAGLLKRARRGGLVSSAAYGYTPGPLLEKWLGAELMHLPGLPQGMHVKRLQLQSGSSDDSTSLKEAVIWAMYEFRHHYTSKEDEAPCPPSADEVARELGVNAREMRRVFRELGIHVELETGVEKGPKGVEKGPKGCGKRTKGRGKRTPIRSKTEVGQKKEDRSAGVPAQVRGGVGNSETQVTEKDMIDFPVPKKERIVLRPPVAVPKKVRDTTVSVGGYASSASTIQEVVVEQRQKRVATVTNRVSEIEINFNCKNLEQHLNDKVHERFPAITTNLPLTHQAFGVLAKKLEKAGFATNRAKLDFLDMCIRDWRTVVVHARRRDTRQVANEGGQSTYDPIPDVPSFWALAKCFGYFLAVYNNSKGMGVVAGGEHKAAKDKDWARKQIEQLNIASREDALYQRSRADSAERELKLALARAERAERRAAPDLEVDPDADLYWPGETRPTAPVVRSCGDQPY